MIVRFAIHEEPSGHTQLTRHNQFCSSDNPKPALIDVNNCTLGIIRWDYPWENALVTFQGNIGSQFTACITPDLGEFEKYTRLDTKEVFVSREQDVEGMLKLPLPCVMSILQSTLILS